MDTGLAQTTAGMARGEPIPTRGISVDLVSVWQRITHAYGLFLWARETSLSVESVPAIHQRQEAQKHWAALKHW